MTTNTIETPRLVRELPPDFKLAHGSHSSFTEGACLMEAVAYVAGLPHSDEPECDLECLDEPAACLTMTPRVAFERMAEVIGGAR